jgi:hypothetical protein
MHRVGWHKKPAGFRAGVRQTPAKALRKMAAAA